MEYSPYGNLESMMKSHCGLRFGLKNDLALDVGHGICALHQAKLIWGDAKPINVLVFDTGNSLHPFLLKIADFGNSKSDSEPCEFRTMGSGYWIKPWTVDQEIQPSAPSNNQSLLTFEEAKMFDLFVFGLIICWLFLEPRNFEEELVGQGHLAWNTRVNLAQQTKQIDKACSASFTAVKKKYSSDLEISKLAPSCSVYDVARLEDVFKATLCAKPNPDIKNTLQLLEKRGIYVSRYLPRQLVE
jgi:serine/threonine protein kinase